VRKQHLDLVRRGERQRLKDANGRGAGRGTNAAAVGRQAPSPAVEGLRGQTAARAEIDDRLAALLPLGKDLLPGGALGGARAGCGTN
jgi:hypothetical protein